MSSQDSTTPILTSQEQAAVRRRVRKPTAETAAPATVATFSPSPVNEADGQEHPSLPQRFLRWLRGAVAAGYGISLLFHGILLLVMSLVVYSELTKQESIEMVVSEGEEVESLEDIMDVKIDMPSGDLAAALPMDTAMTTETVDWAENPVVSGVEDSLESLFEKQGAGGAGGGGFLAPKNSRVFTKGSFTVWTEPNDPKPGEDYKIVIVIKLPERVQRYKATDLKGMVVGTDDYRQAIPGPEYTRGRVYLPMKDHTAQLIVPVPGGSARVRDTIDIRSITLGEEQTLQIEF